MHRRIDERTPDESGPRVGWATVAAELIKRPLAFYCVEAPTLFFGHKFLDSRMGVFIVIVALTAVSVPFLFVSLGCSLFRSCLVTFRASAGARGFACLGLLKKKPKAPTVVPSYEKRFAGLI